MPGTNYLVDNRNIASIETLIDAFEARGTTHETTIRSALRLIDRPFTLQIDHIGHPALSPLQDQFTFDMDTDALILYTDSPAALIDALLEMAMFLRGFNTLLGVQDEWKINIAMGAWRYVRVALKSQFDLYPVGGKDWTAPLDSDAVERFDMASFNTIVFLASRPDVEALFPSGANALVISAYERLARIMETVALNITLNDHQTFNRRLNRALTLIEESILPKDGSPFDDLFGPEGFSDKFFDEDRDD